MVRWRVVVPPGWALVATWGCMGGQVPEAVEDDGEVVDHSAVEQALVAVQAPAAEVGQAGSRLGLRGAHVPLRQGAALQFEARFAQLLRAVPARLRRHE